MARFTLFWNSGKKENVKGKNLTDAFKAAGYKNKDIQKLSFFEDGDCDLYEFDKEKSLWFNKETKELVEVRDVAQQVA